MEPTSKNQGGPSCGAPQKKSRGTDNHQTSTTNQLWNQGGLTGGSGCGPGCNQTFKRAVTFDMSQNQAMDSLNRYSPQQQPTHTNQEVIATNNEPDISTNGWGWQKSISNNVPPLSINDGLGS